MTSFNDAGYKLRPAQGFLAEAQQDLKLGGFRLKTRMMPVESSFQIAEAVLKRFTPNGGEG